MDTNPENKFLLKAENLTVQRIDGDRIITLVDALSFEVKNGETIGLVGESGSGKTLTALAIMGLLPKDEGWKISGQIHFGQIDINTASASALSRIRGRKLAMIFQEPANALNPVMTCGWQIAEVLRTHFSLTKSESHPEVIRLLNELEFEDPLRVFNSYPHELSGGMRQRILIAMALAGEPLVIIADEPTSMLDPDNQLNIMRLIRNSVCKKQAGLIIITHDLSLLSSVDTIIVMYASRIVELGTADNILKTPNHPYTRKLLALTHSDTSKRLPVISGSILPPKRYFDGCHFFERCEYAMPVCQKQKPRLLPLGGSHYTACQLNVG